jgi:hypothetical protein
VLIQKKKNNRTKDMRIQEIDTRDRIQEIDGPENLFAREGNKTEVD